VTLTVQQQQFNFCLSFFLIYTAFIPLPPNKPTVMNKFILLVALSVLLSFSTYAQDAEGTQDPPMFPTRMANYLRTESVANFDAVDFNVAPAGSKIISKEGNKSSTRYEFNAASGQQKPSSLQILRNYEAASKKIGAVTKYLNAGEGLAVFELLKDNSDTWIKVETGGNDNSDFYIITVLSIEAMTQEVNAKEILSALNTDGHISLYINFETGKSTIKAESQKTIDQLAEMLNASPTVKISIEGHTDNVGTPAANQVLSENRAKAVLKSLVNLGISETRLSSKGWGETKGITANKTEEDRAKNRRVEIVKM
jgi:OmpA-OmpF porin, OOP family